MRYWIPVVTAAAFGVGCQCQKASLGGGSSSGGTSAAATGGSSTGGTTGSHGATAGGTTGGGSSGGGSSGDGGSSCAASYSALALSPATSSVTLDGSAPAPISFTVQGTTSKGQVAVDPSQLAWTATRSDDTNPGSVVAGVFTPFAGAGGTVTITATGCGASGSATVTLSLDETFQADGGAPAAFASDGGVSGSPNAPTLVYPSDQTRFPRNVYKILFQWKPNGNTQFRLSFSGPGSTVTVYTDGQDPACAGVSGAACWQADAVSWDAIAGSNAGATVQVELDGTQAPGGTIYLGKPETLGFSAKDVRGAIFYWAANRGGIERATVSDAAPQDYLVGNQVQGVPATQVDGYTVQCAACHAVSRDGLKMAASMQAQGPTNVHGMWVMDVTVNPPPLPIVTSVPAASGDGYSAFSPDTTKLVWGPRNGGQLSVIDATNGSTISQISVGGTAIQGSAVDWSPTAGLIAYADTKGGISTVGVDPTGTQFSNAAQLVPGGGGGGGGGPGGPGGGGGLDFPMFDPEGDQLAYTNGTELFVVPPSGGTPVQLTTANDVVNDATVTPSENSMPTWAPPGDLHWIAFNSQRPYGLLTQGGKNQIWVAAVDLSKLPDDPSYPGFWLPFQNLTDLNHRAFWTLDVRTDYDGGVPDAGPLPDAGAVDAGSTDAGLPPCVPFGDPCSPATSTCCDPNGQGNYCGMISDGGTLCVSPGFK
ncbi:MAG: hypothetical protein ACYCWW_14485 [Deltaproteobacteria bacterium]